MKHWFVTLRMYIGEFEKLSQLVIEAPTEDTAKLAALCAESHGPATIIDGKWWDGGGQMVYEVQEIIPISIGIYAMLREIRCASNHYDPEEVADICPDYAEENFTP